MSYNYRRTVNTRHHHLPLEGNTQSLVENEFGNVLVIYTGGTIGMKLNKQGVYSNDKDLLYHFLETMPMFNDLAYAAKRHQMDCDPPFFKQFTYPPLFMPVVGSADPKHITYILYEYQQLKFYKKFDAFVILHGTDTMCYTAAALSFILEELGKPVIITGSCIPIYETRSDGQDNLLGALIMAASFNIPEVCVFFNNHLFRGNRTRKVSADTLDAFDSPNFPALGKLEMLVTVYWDLIQKPSTVKPFNVHTMLSQNVAVLRVFPNLSAAVVRAFLQDPIQGIVMQCYGAGNFPDENLELLSVLQEACDRGIIVVNTTQCRRGTVSISYAGAKSLLDVGVVAGYDMTSEAALAKLSYVLTKPWTLQEKKEFMSRNIRGELTVSDDILKDQHLTDGLTALGLDFTMVGKAVKPGAVLDKNYEGRTALHLAVREGNLATIQYLIKQGALVHSKDIWGRQPLLDAVYVRRFDVIELLRKSGAHLTLHPQKLAMELNEAVWEGDLELIKAFWIAGASFNAVINWKMECVEYILQHAGNPLLTDDAGRTVQQLTVNTRIISLLESAVAAARWTKGKAAIHVEDSPAASVEETAEGNQLMVSLNGNGVKVNTEILRD
ncbi:hypothetical protein EB796_014235 [Bugula neritina]|uniref:asparaginase n=1 Tax=Bugula neritina TaxID=10212 RepID=A0A7J7JNL3_BUGNE|nr:hypothetical protein EB796_014235 [Bugula neritina]